MERVPLATSDDVRLARAVAGMLCEVGVMLIRAGEISDEIQLKLRDIGARYGLAVRSFVVPTGLFVRVGGHQIEAMDFLGVQNPILTLDQIRALYTLVEHLRATADPVVDVHGELARIDAMPAAPHMLVEIPGYAVLTVGLGLLLAPGPAGLVGYLVLGVVVGVLRSVLRHVPSLAVVTPLVAAFAVTVISLRWSGPLLGVDPGVMLIPPLIAFLPGSVLTMGVMELATRGMVAGVARIAEGIAVLLSLSVGILLGTSVVVAHRPAHPAHVWGAWAPWIGVGLLGVGFAVGNRAPVRTLHWLLGALLIIWAVQVAATGVLTPAFGALAAGVALPIVARIVARRADIPAQVTFLPAFWMIVPGAAGLAAVSEVFTGPDRDATRALVTTATTTVAIALGILIGTRVQRRRDVVTIPHGPDIHA